MKKTVICKAPVDTITVEDVEIAVEKIPEIVLEYKGDPNNLAILKYKALSLGATVNWKVTRLTIDTYENHRDEIESLADELGVKKAKSDEEAQNGENVD